MGVPYLHHRYQITATGSVIGGVDYIYSYRGDGRRPFKYVSGADQRAALDALLHVIEPSQLALPRSVIDQIPPRPSGFGAGRQYFPRWTGSMFDVITPAVVLADHAVSNIVDNAKAARLIEQSALDPTTPNLGEVIDRLFAAVFGAETASDYEAEISRAVGSVAVARVMGLAAGAAMPQVRAIALQKLERQGEALEGMVAAADDSDAAHYALLAGTIERFLEDPSAGPFLPAAPGAPPGAPIGQGPQDYLAGSEWIAGLGVATTSSLWLQAFDLACYWVPEM